MHVPIVKGNEKSQKITVKVANDMKKEGNRHGFYHFEKFEKAESLTDGPKSRVILPKKLIFFSSFFKTKYKL